MRFFIVLTFVSGFLFSDAFRTCRDARNYGNNMSTLYAKQAYKSIRCNYRKMPRLERFLANKGLDIDLDGALSDEKKLCFFEGYYEGLYDTVDEEERKCYRSGHDRFSCMTIETHVRYTTNSYKSLVRENRRVLRRDIQTVFERRSLRVCEFKKESCYDLVLEALYGIGGDSLNDELALIVCGEGY